MEVDGIRRPRKTWWDGAGKDMKRFGRSQEESQDQDKWRRKVEG